MSYSINLTPEQADLIIIHYLPYEVEITSEYTLFRAKVENAAMTIFKTYKLLVQGKTSKDLYVKVCEILGIEPILAINDIAPTKTLSLELSLIGTDEVGTGDFFGGIVVAAAFVPKSELSHLTKLGVKDSKQLSDARILELAPQLLRIIPHSIHLLNNLKFNYLTQVHHYNMNKIKAIMHNSVIKNLKTKVEDYDGIIIDGFTTTDKYLEYLSDEKEIAKDVRLIEKAENKYISVAVASIIARYTFLNHFDKLSEEIGFELPKGAGSKVDNAIAKILKTKPFKYLNNIAKTNFKNIDKYRIADKSSL